MRYFKFVIGFLFIGILIAGIVLAKPKPYVKVSYVSGEVKFLKSGETVWQGIKEGISLFSGDSIKTYANSFVEIAFDGNKDNIVSIKPEAYLVLKLIGREKIELIDGEVFSLIKRLPRGSQFEIRTPTAVCGARGTGWGANTDKNKTVVSAYENDSYVKGITEDGSPMEDKTIVEEGYRSIVKRFKKPSRLMKISQKDMEAWDDWKSDLIDRVSGVLTARERLARNLEKIQGQKEKIEDRRDVNRIEKRTEETLVPDEEERDKLLIKKYTKGEKIMKFSIPTILFILSFNLYSFAEDVTDIKIQDYLKPLTYIETLTQPVKRHLRKNNIDLNFFAGILQGYDNNVNLNPDRKKDGFLQTSLNTEVTYNYTEDIRLKMENDTTDLLYYTIKGASLLDIYNKAGLEVDIYGDMFTLGADYAFSIVLFPCDEEGNYLGNQAGIFAKHNINPNLYHKIAYKYLHKGFTHDKTLNSSYVRTGDLRKDNRHGMYYEAGLYLFDRAIVKTNLDFYRNNANYQYYDYHDYWSFKLRPSFIFMITKNLYTSGSFTYQQRRYDGRLSSEDNEHVYDDTYSFNASLLYDLTRSFIVALNYSYRENSSNEPLQKYSGSVMTAGLYYSF